MADAKVELLSSVSSLSQLQAAGFTYRRWVDSVPYRSRLHRLQQIVVIANSHRWTSPTADGADSRVLDGTATQYERHYQSSMGVVPDIQLHSTSVMNQV